MVDAMQSLLLCVALRRVGEEGSHLVFMTEVLERLLGCTVHDCSAATDPEVALFVSRHLGRLGPPEVFTAVVALQQLSAPDTLHTA
jgi:hypothetical protein